MADFVKGIYYRRMINPSMPVKYEVTPVGNRLKIEWVNSITNEYGMATHSEEQFHSWKLNFLDEHYGFVPDVRENKLEELQLWLVS